MKAPRRAVRRSAAMNAGGGPRTATVRVRSRWDDCDRYGHVNNAAYLAMIRAAHDRAGMPNSELRALEITFRQPVPPEVMVNVDVAFLEQGESHKKIAYALQVDGWPAADATMLWQLAGPPLMPNLPPIDRDAGGQPFRFRQAVRSTKSSRTALPARRPSCSGSSTPSSGRPSAGGGHASAWSRRHS